MKTWNSILGEEWYEILKDELSKPYFVKLLNFIRDAYLTKTIYPVKDDVFNAYKLTQPSDIKVVIIGQD